MTLFLILGVFITGHVKARFAKPVGSKCGHNLIHFTGNSDYHGDFGPGDHFIQKFNLLKEKDGDRPGAWD